MTVDWPSKASGDSCAAHQALANTRHRHTETETETETAIGFGVCFGPNDFANNFAFNFG